MINESHDYQEYYKYLRKRHPLSYLYRRKLLYPKYKTLLELPGLEIGCGMGEYLEFHKGFVGVDINPQVVEHCQKFSLDVVLGSAYDLPFDHNRFKSVLLDNVLEHLDNYEKCFLEIHRILANHGKVLIIVPNKKGWEKDPTHIKFWNEENLPNAMTKFNFNILKTFHFPINHEIANGVWSYNFFCLQAEKYE